MLAVGAHPDDVELGCAGTLAARKAAGDEFGVLVVTRGDAQRGVDHRQRAREADVAARMLGAEAVGLLGYGESDACYPRVDLVGEIRDEIEKVMPDVVYCHSREDAHQVHAAVARATIAACMLVGVREVYAFEVPSTTTRFSPTAFQDITGTLQVKLRALKCFGSQKGKYYMLEEAVAGLARHRAYQARLPAAGGPLAAAEAFEVERMVRG